jgi:hypothetical protein
MSLSEVFQRKNISFLSKFKTLPLIYLDRFSCMYVFLKAIIGYKKPIIFVFSELLLLRIRFYNSVIALHHLRFVLVLEDNLERKRLLELPSIPRSTEYVSEHTA